MRLVIIFGVFLIQFYSVFLGADVFSASGQCLDDQKVLLLRLKESLKFNSSLSVKLVTWDSKLDCCSWEGVGCESGRVVKLDLAKETVSDGIDNSSSLFDLQHLEEVNLAYNRFNSIDIPSRFDELINLTYLNLSNAGFSGQIPLCIAGLTRLVNLDISNLYFLGMKPLKLESPNLRTLVRNLTSIKELHLDGVNISTGGNDWCKALSSSLPNLSVLSLSYCNLRGPIDSSLANLQFLSDVRLDNNNLSTEVPIFFANFTNLTALSFSSSGIRGRFPDQIFKVPTLKAIDLTNNELLQGTLPEFPQNSSLERLVLSSSNFFGELPYSIGNLQVLSRIDLLLCSFSGFLPSSVSNLTKLVYVDMSSNSFTGPIPSLSFARNLTQLYLAHNLFNGSINSTVWNGLSQLSILDLRNNSLSGTIPSSLFTIPLQKLQLSNNHFDKLTISNINVSSSLLDALDLSYNNLDGSFPMSIIMLPNLKILLLASNNFTGTIEMGMITQIKNLSNLDLSHNSLWIDTNDSNASLSFFNKFTTLKLAFCGIRKFPDFLKDQSKLTYLDLSMNQIPGKIPSWIWSISTLMYLNLSNNHLVGFENPVANVTSLSILDLHSNKLDGELPLPRSATYLDFSLNNFGSSIPSDIGSALSFCYFFSLSSNNFTGKIPESICSATYLLGLDLSNNSLSGTIPECLSNFSEILGVINLQMNNLNGSISDSFRKGCGLKTLDLSGNRLTGPVPNSLAYCTELEVLNLGNNNLSDTFPLSLMNMSSLRVLVLRSNSFHGEVGCRGAKENWTRLQIVDLSSNSFSGKLPPLCFLRWNAMIANSDETGPTHLRSDVLTLSKLFYVDTVMVTIKGLELKLVKILTVFTAIDFSSNKFEGSIPGWVGEFTSLFVLNFSHNSFSGGIPASLGNLSQLESLDLSSNTLTGTIPQELVALTFLSFLNLSSNRLEGLIPRGNQFDTFSSESFLENKALCGKPLRACSNGSLMPPSGKQDSSTSSSCYDLQFIVTGIGFGVGSGLALAPLIFWNEGRKWHDKQAKTLLLMILPYFRLVYIPDYEGDSHEDEQDDAGSEETESSKELDSGIQEERIFQGRFCVYCSKLDMSRKIVVHNPKCTCHDTPQISFFVFFIVVVIFFLC